MSISLCQWKQKWKVLKIQVVTISEFHNMNGIYVQRFALYFQFKWTEKEENEESKKNTCAEKSNSQNWRAVRDFDVF